MECYISGDVYFYGLVGSSIFLYYTYDSLMKLMNNEISSKLTRIESELELAREEIKQLLTLTVDTIDEDKPAEHTD
jgi:hypothetical protein